MNKTKRGFAVAFLALILLPLAGLPAQAAGPSLPPRAPHPRPAADLTAADLEAFLDGVVAMQMDQSHVAGVTLSVVKDGQLLLAKGYGYADVEQRIPVDPAKTLFRIGSISKLFTWTAVMQLVERGELDLEADVNRYIDFQIPAAFSEPITLVHLLTHMPGFEDRGFGLAARTPEELLPNGVWLARNVPARMWAPGLFPAYSNYGATLAGYIVERQAGVPYDDYVDAHILAPLGMVQTTSRQPLPAGLAGAMSGGYRYVNGGFEPQAFELLHVAPAGSFSASATDMARFMIAHLQDGRYEQARILDEATARRMHGRLWGPDDRLNGMAYGFMELSQNGRRVIGHGGDTAFFHSLLALLPAENVGLFVSYNTESAAMLPQALFEAFMDRYYPAPAAEPLRPPADFAARAARFAGEYRLNRMSFTKVEKIMALFSPVTVQDGGDGTLVVNSPFGVQRYVEIAPLLFHEVDGDEQLLFREDAQGNPRYVFIHSEPIMVGEKVAWYDSTTLHMALLAVCYLLFFSLLVAGPVGFFVNRGRTDLPPRSPLARLARGVLGGVALLAMALAAGTALLMGDIVALMAGDRGILTVLGVISVLLAGLTAAAVVLAAAAWIRGYWRPAGRIHYTLVTLAAVALVWFLNYWNLLGWRF